MVINTVRQTAERLGISTAAVHGLIKRGSLAAERIAPGLIVVTNTAIDSLLSDPVYLRRRRAASPAPAPTSAQPTRRRPAPDSDQNLAQLSAAIRAKHRQAGK